MFEIVKAGGWLMLPIIACSVVALAIVAERLWVLREKRVIPRNLVAQIWQWARDGELNDTRIRALQQSSPLGKVLAVGLINRHHEREVMKESIEEAGRAVVHDLERFLNALGTIAAVTPLLGLLGTVIGMIAVFTTITTVGVGNPSELAGGISQALITTAGGLSVAIPSLIFHRYFRGKIDALVVSMEQETIKLVEVLHGKREGDYVVKRAPGKR
ncbi:MAG: MotA/TolQ/ExbB proton channel family protein [Gammaproteobacteria bacterium]|nr:MotA/TolQ/ExbB proton channel family protein [Gammaproteobacteria bacterium]